MRKILKVIRYPVAIELGYYVLLMLLLGVPYLLKRPLGREWPPRQGLDDYLLDAAPYVVVLALVSLLYGCYKFKFGFLKTLLLTSLFVFGHVYGFWVTFAASFELFQQDTEYIVRTLREIFWSKLPLCAGASIAIAGAHWLVGEILRRKKSAAESDAPAQTSVP